MSVQARPEAPQWAVARAANFVKKHMDEDAQVPFDQLSPAKQLRQQGRWLAYTYTLDDRERAYIYQRAVDTVEAHAFRHRFDPAYHLADLGAGNGMNTIRTARMLEDTTKTQNFVHLVEQSGAALEAADTHFTKNDFFPGSEKRTKVHLLQGDVVDTGLPTRSMDAVTIVNVWHHLDSWDKLVGSANEIDRVLKPGGIFAVVDTRALPERGLRRKIVQGAIRRAVNPGKFVYRALQEGVKVEANLIAGIEDFCTHDAFKAFENALTKEQFEEVLRKSALAPSLRGVEDLLSPNLMGKIKYPALNFAWGIKQ